MCRALLEALAGAGYRMTEYEALVFLPAVVEKAGHNQVRWLGGWCWAVLLGTSTGIAVGARHTFSGRQVGLHWFVGC